MKRAAWACVLLLAGCAAQEEAEPLHTAVTTQPAPDPFEGLEDAVAAIEKETGTEVGVSLFDGSEMTQAGSLYALPAWSTIKIPIARAAVEHCDYGKEYVEELTQASIEWSDNDSARALWDCMGSDKEAAEKVRDEIAKSGSKVQVEGAFGTTSWSFPGQARYAFYLSQQDEDDPVIMEMHHIAEDQSYGLGTLETVPFKGGWSDDESDGSWHTRQFGWFDGYGVAIGARSEDGSYDDTTAALDKVAQLLKLRLDRAEDGSQNAEDDQDDANDSLNL